MKNECLKRRPVEDPYEIWKSKTDDWVWKVLKKYQADDDKQFARWFVFVTSPYCPDGEYGDEYVSNIKSKSVRIQ